MPSGNAGGCNLYDPGSSECIASILFEKKEKT
jgi:hypothetical protein